MFWGAKTTLRAPVQNHAHDVYEFIVAQQAGGEIGYGKHSIPLGAGQTVFIPAGVEHRITASPQAPMSVQFVCAGRATLESALSVDALTLLTKMDNAGVSVADHEDNQMLTLMEHLHSALQDGRSHGKLVAGSLFAVLLASHNASHQARPSLATTRNVAGINRATQWLANNFNTDVSTDALAMVAGMSRSAFQRAFKKSTGKTLIEYCTQLRLNEAERQLRRSDASIAAISFETGFNNLSHFHRVFRRHFGVTPQTYRSMRQAET